jgi:DnaK suppressor protein
VRTLRRALEERLREIRLRLGDLDDGADRGGDEADSAAASVIHDLTVDERERLTTQATAIRRALGRMDAGTYGRCEDCGQRIAPSRLQALPYADACIDCQSTREAMALADERPAGIRRVPRPTRPLEELGP